MEGNRMPNAEDLPEPLSSSGLVLSFCLPLFRLNSRLLPFLTALLPKDVLRSRRSLVLLTIPLDPGDRSLAFVTGSMISRLVLAVGLEKKGGASPVGLAVKPGLLRGGGVDGGTVVDAMGGGGEQESMIGIWESKPIPFPIRLPTPAGRCAAPYLLPESAAHCIILLRKCYRFARPSPPGAATGADSRRF